MTTFKHTIIAALLSLSTLACIEPAADVDDVAAFGGAGPESINTEEPPEVLDDEAGTGGMGQAPVEACCYCTDGGGWVCDVWEGGAESCIEWGYEQGLTVSWFQDCPGAATDDPEDDYYCPASCA